MSAPHRLTLERDGTAKCICCLESFPPTDVHELSCWHAYCSNCVRVMFTTSFQSEGKFPPHCCDTPIDLTPRLVPVLGKEIWSVYIAKRNEFRTKTRVYCSNTNCGSFITDDHQFDGFAICGKCDSLTCTNCKNPYHDGDCSLHDGSHEIKELAKKEGWVECYKCGNILEKMEGCVPVEREFATSALMRLTNAPVERSVALDPVAGRSETSEDLIDKSGRNEKPSDSCWKY
ncbi:hypothetical protein F4805DRAFT_453169 [Annulohypoxylon moriforme]|nr:hypothetical protein F4805DRAFT_453169 [Annulohypoxylon moriforme]